MLRKEKKCRHVKCSVKITKSKTRVEDKNINKKQEQTQNNKKYGRY